MSSETLVRIVPHSIEKGEIPFSLYASDSRKGVVLFCKAGFSITDDHLLSLQESKRTFYIGGNEVANYQEYAQKRLSTIIESENTSTDDKIGFLKSMSEISLTNLFKDPRSAKAMETSGDFVKSYLDVIMHSNVALDSLFSISLNSSYSLSHSINVCTFCILIGSHFYGNNHEKLWKLGLGGMLMDIGMGIMDKNILERKAPLEDNEKNNMRLHTLKSEEIIREHDLPEDVQKMGRNHHERADGSGYPDKLKLHKISEFARIAAVCDVYDAMTSERGYRKKMSHYEALAEMSLDKHLYDHRVLEILMKIVLQNDTLVQEFMVGGPKVKKLCRPG